MESQKTLKSKKIILRKKNKAGGIYYLISNYTTRLQQSKSKQHDTGIKTDEVNRIESLEINQCLYDKGGKNIQWSEDSLFNKGCWES